MKKIFILFAVIFTTISICHATFDEYIRYSVLADNAWKQGNCTNAINYLNKSLQYESIYVAPNRATYYVQFAILYWNIGQSNRAQEFMQAAIKIMQTDSSLGSGCEQRAVVFLQKMQQRKLPNYFNYHHGNNIMNYIREIPDAVFEHKMEDLTKRYAALGVYFDSMKATYQRQGESQARMARAYARQEYQSKTGSTFSPHNPPASGTSARNEWDACKVIYDIFGN